MDESSGDHVITQVSDILKPTLQDNDFLQSFVRIGLDESGPETRKKPEVRKESKDTGLGGLDFQDSTSGRRGRDDRASSRPHRRPGKGSVEFEITEQMSKKVRRRKTSGARRLEEVYTDKDRAAAVNLGTRDIIQSLKIKRRQDRNKMMQIPDEAEPSAMLALGAREMRSGDLGVAINCINKALELSPHDKNALLARSKCYLLLGEPQKALEDAEAALNEKIKDPNNARAMFYKAEALYHLGDFELSLVYYYRGMRIRPEFDQFRLGVQKAKEAIQNILGNSSVPMQFDTRQHEGNGTNESGRTLEGADESLTHPGPSYETVRSFGEKKREQGPVKRRNNSPNVLGQLNVDKKYLQDLLKSPDIKAAHQVSAQHITKYAEEGVSFLKNRQEFWRQQRSAFHAGF